VEGTENEPLTNAGRDFLAGYLLCHDIYWGETQAERLDEESLSDAKFKAREYEQMVHMDPERTPDA
jgi:hypothetical protein